MRNRQAQFIPSAQAELGLIKPINPMYGMQSMGGSGGGSIMIQKPKGDSALWRQSVELNNEYTKLEMEANDIRNEMSNLISRVGFKDFMNSTDPKISEDKNSLNQRWLALVQRKNELDSAKTLARNNADQFGKDLSNQNIDKSSVSMTGKGIDFKVIGIDGEEYTIEEYGDIPLEHFFDRVEKAREQGKILMPMSVEEKMRMDQSDFPMFRVDEHGNRKANIYEAQVETDYNKVLNQLLDRSKQVGATSIKSKQAMPNGLVGSTKIELFSDNHYGLLTLLDQVENIMHGSFGPDVKNYIFKEWVKKVASGTPQALYKIDSNPSGKVNVGGKELVTKPTLSLKTDLTYEDEIRINELSEKSGGNIENLSDEEKLELDSLRKKAEQQFDFDYTKESFLSFALETIMGIVAQQLDFKAEMGTEVSAMGSSVNVDLGRQEALNEWDSARSGVEDMNYNYEEGDYLYGRNWTTGRNRIASIMTSGIHNVIYTPQEVEEVLRRTDEKQKELQSKFDQLSNERDPEIRKELTKEVNELRRGLVNDMRIDIFNSLQKKASYNGLSSEKKRKIDEAVLNGIQQAMVGHELDDPYKYGVNVYKVYKLSKSRGKYANDEIGGYTNRSNIYFATGQNITEIPAFANGVKVVEADAMILGGVDYSLPVTIQGKSYRYGDLSNSMLRHYYTTAKSDYRKDKASVRVALPLEAKEFRNSQIRVRDRSGNAIFVKGKEIINSNGTVKSDDDAKFYAKQLDIINNPMGYGEYTKGFIEKHSTEKFVWFLGIDLNPDDFAPISNTGYTPIQGRGNK